MSQGTQYIAAKRQLLSIAAVASMCMLTLVKPALAENNAIRPQEQPAQELEQITVTARKRDENIQEVPLAIVALSEKMIKERNVVRIQDINALTPNLTIETGAGVAGGASFVMRGIGSYDYELYADSPVSFYVDGVLWARPHTVNGEMFDIDRIEVLYGPQGTLFGRNTTGGAINVKTRQPKDDFGFEQKGGYGSNNEFESRTIVDTGSFAAGKMKAMLGYFHSQMDGWQRDLNTSDRNSPGSRNVNSVLGQLHGDATDTLSFDWRFDWRRIDYVPTAYELIDVSQDLITYYANSPANGGNPFVYVNRPTILRNIYQDVASKGSDEESGGTSFTLNYNPSRELNIKDILAYRKMDQFSLNDPGGQGFLYGPVLDPVTFLPAGIQPVTPLDAVTNNRQHQISNELQFTGEVDRFNYAAGVYYFEEKSHGRQFTNGTFVLPGGLEALNFAAGRDYYLDTKSAAVYGQLSYRPPVLDDKLEVTGGVRYTNDRKGFSQTIYSNDVETATQSLDKEWNNVSYLASLKYKLTDDVNAYLRFSTGYKAGGFNPGTIQAPYNPEKAEAVEVGLKSLFWDNRINLNLALFHTKYNDLQTTQFVEQNGSQSNQVLNAARATYDGLEIEFAVKPVEDVRIDLGVGLIDPKYQSFIIQDPVTFLSKDVSDTAKFQLLSKQSYRVGLEYDVSAVTVGKLSANVDFTYKSERFWYAVQEFNPRNDIIKGNPAHILTAHINWASIPLGKGDALLTLGLHGNNLLNQNLVEAGADLGSLGAGFINFARPRSYMIDATVSF
ncbi:MAG TPA: TonB-dependent receptor [Steroidobacteraceae bacterium]|jgi:iron complex outermembrane receptor protein